MTKPSELELCPFCGGEAIQDKEGYTSKLILARRTWGDI